jgi:DNA-binding MarR family transcriptional regulator
MDMDRKPIAKLLSCMNRQIQKNLTKELKPYQLSGGGQSSFLIEILNRPGINQDQLTTELKFDKATTARAVKHLENTGYIVRKIAENDRRSYRLYPTQKGVDFHPILLGILESVNNQLTRQLTQGEQEQLISLLKKLNVDGGEI